MGLHPNADITYQVRIVDVRCICRNILVVVFRKYSVILMSQYNPRRSNSLTSTIHDSVRGFSVGGLETCGPRERLTWHASEFSLPKIEHNIP